MKTLHFIFRQRALIIFALIVNWAVMSGIKYRWLGEWEFDEMKGSTFHPRTIAERFGTSAYAIEFTALIFLLAAFLIHFRYRNTIDADAAGGRDVTDWNSLSPTERSRIRAFVFIGVFIGLCILCSNFARGADVDEVARWKNATLNPRYSLALDLAVDRFKRTEPRYQKIEAMRKNGVPAPILFCLHYRESDNDFSRHAHEGSSLLHRTRDEPKGRLPYAEPPYTFEQSAEDAYYICEHPPLDRIDWRSLQSALDKMESFNGFGYRRYGIASPYNFSGTSLYRSGKFVRDGYFSRTAVDAQLGCVAILKRMQARGIRLPFASES